MSAAIAPTSARVRNAAFQFVRATNSPTARHRNGYAGRTYVGSLLPEQLKKNTHHPPATSQRPPAADGGSASPGPPRSSFQRYAASRIVPGKSPPTRIG